MYEYMRTVFRRWFVCLVCFYERYSLSKNMFLITGIKYIWYMATVFQYDVIITGMECSYIRKKLNGIEYK